MLPIRKNKQQLENDVTNKIVYRLMSLIMGQLSAKSLNSDFIMK